MLKGGPVYRKPYHSPIKGRGPGTYHRKPGILKYRPQHLKNIRFTRLSASQLLLEKCQQPFINPLRTLLRRPKLQEFLKQGISNNRYELIRRLNLFEILNEVVNCFNLFQSHRGLVRVSHNCSHGSHRAHLLAEHARYELQARPMIAFERS